ncbi:hypothetical protein KP509_37G027000 [Ceratopteris richardii]|uniref:Rhamnogalacturonase A/B/Epimerase-like pectate lyase domain-containing protein n=1 Tax=Ceratopteris richardii TaxID=49495 RepID=A0A8T2Q7C8_CERRI|nr:hypothetical protein KP509_37G027000 [Ceratopteris richardii]
MIINEKMQRIVLIILLLCLSFKCTVLGDVNTKWNRFSPSSPAALLLTEKDFCSKLRSLPKRAHFASIEDYGAIGDGETLNTQAFHDAISHLSAFSNQGGSQLYIPPGRWLTGNFNVTSHFTLFIDKDAVILGSQNPRDWPVVDPLPSYGRGRELPGGRHISLIYGNNLSDVIITGNNGTIDGQGKVWWELHANGSLDYTRGHLLELMNSKDIIISNLTFINSPFWNIHPVYCRNVLIQYLTILAPIDSSNTDGIDPDSSSRVCIEDCYVENGDDLVSIKSGWDEYGIRYGRPSSKIVIRRLAGATRSSAGVAIGSEMSGGVSHVYVYDLKVGHASTGVRIKSAQGRGGYVKHVYVSDVVLRNVKTAIAFTGLYGEHPDDLYDPNALPHVHTIYIQNVKGDNVTMAGNFQGLPGYPYRDIFLRNITLNVTSRKVVWNCSYLTGYSESVSPPPCAALVQKATKKNSASTSIS